MAVRDKGKQVAADPPGASGSGSKRRNGSGDAGPSSSSAKRRRRRSGVLQFVDDAAGVDDDYEEEENEGDSEEEDLDDGVFTEKHVENGGHNRTERSHPLPFLVKEEELSGDELEEFVRNRYSTGVKYAADPNIHQEDDDDMFPMMDGAPKEPTIWKVKCMVGRERQMVFCLMQKFVDLKRIGTKVPIITAFALDHVRGFVFIEAEKTCDVTEACRGFCSVYASRITSVSAADVPSLLSSRTKPLEIARGTWVRMKNGNYKGDLAQVVSGDDGRKRVMIKLIPRVDLRAISRKFGGAISLKEAGVPAPRLISSQELEFFRPHIEMKRDRQTGEVFEVLDGLMLKDGFLYKRVALSSLIYWGIQPTETELLKFSSSQSDKCSAEDLEWLSGMYGSKKRNLPEHQDMKASSSKMKSSKASNCKASTSTEIFDDNEEFNLHDLVLFGRKDFGVIIAFEKDGLKILKGGPEGSAVTVRKQDIKKSCVDKMFTAVDHKKKIISVNDTVRVLEGPFQGKEGVVKHLYLGILFIYNENESDNFGFFCAQCGSCENIKKRKEMGNSSAENLEDSPIPMFSQPSYEQNEQRSSERPYKGTRDQLFSVGQMLRIRKGPMKGYLCRVVRIFRNNVTVKLDSLLKIVTVQAEFLSVPSNRGDITSGAPTGNLGSQDTSFFGSEAGATSWDNRLPSFGSDSWQPFSSSTLPIQNTDGETEADPWGKKTVSSTEDDSDPWSKKTLPSADGNSDPWGKKMDSSAGDDSDPWGKKMDSSAGDNSDPWGKKIVSSADGDSDPWGKKVVSSADGDSDPWGKKTSSAAEGWNNTQKEGSSDHAWGKQAGVGGLNAAGSSWDRTTANKEGEKSDKWGDACRVEDVGTGDTDPWGSKVKASDTEENDNWAKASMPAGVTGRGDGDAWVKSDTLPAVEDDAWGKSKDNTGEGTGGWSKAKISEKNTAAGGWDTAADKWNKSSAVGETQEDAWGKGNAANDWDKSKSFGGDGSSGWNKGDDQNSTWSRPGNFGGERRFGRGRGRGRNSGDFCGRNDEGSWKSSWGGDNEAGDSGGFRGRGRGRGQYGRQGRHDGWRNGDRSNSGFGRESDSADERKWGSRGSFDLDTGASNKGSWAGGGEHNDPWASKLTTTEGKEQQNDTWENKMASTAGAGDNGGSWNSKAKDSYCSDGGEERQNDPWANKTGSHEGKEQEIDPWASKVPSVGADDNNDKWNTKAKDPPADHVDKWSNLAPVGSGAEEKADAWGGGNGNSKNSDGWGAGSSGASWDKPIFSLGDQEPAWGKPRFSDDNNGNSRGGFGCGNRGRGRGRSFGDSGSSWNGGNGNDESGGGRSTDQWNRRDFDGSRGRGRGRFGRGGHNQGNNFGSGDGGSWGFGRGNSGGRGGYRNWNDNNERRPSSGQGGGWSQSSDWNSNKGTSEGDQGFSKSRSSWGADNSDSWGGPKPSGGGDQAGKNAGNNNWCQNRSSPSILGQPSGNKNDSAWGAPSDATIGGGAGGGSSWEKSNEDSWNSSRGTGGPEKSSWGGSEAVAKKDEQDKGSGSQGGGGGSSWDKADDAWNSNKGSDSGGGGW